MKTTHSRLNLSGILLSAFWAWAGIAAILVSAGTISRIIWTSRGGTYINDTIVNATTSPLAFTATNDLAQPFLNAPDSTLTLNYGSYYAIAFRGYGAHIGAGTVSFLLDGVTGYSQNVTFPDPTSASGVFARFELPGGDTVTISATGRSADLIRVVADGPGLAGDGEPDAFYQFNYSRPVEIVPNLRMVPAAMGRATISWPASAESFGLVSRSDLASGSWDTVTNLPVLNGTRKEVLLPTSNLQRFFRLKSGN